MRSTELSSNSSVLKRVVFILGFAAAGALALLFARAITPYASVEVESGVSTGSAQAIADNTAAGGSAVRFGSGSSTPTASFPASVDPSGRYLLDESGSPWLGVGDTAWSLSSQLNDASITAFLDNRAAKGVNLVLMSAPEAYYADTAPRDVTGALPFTGTAFQSPLNEAYWSRVDFTIDYAASKGITLLICPMYTGWGPDGWEPQLIDATNAQMTTYGNYLAARYASKKNIIWLMGHDKAGLSSTLKARGKALADALQAGTTHLVTVASNRSRDGGSFGVGSEEWAGSNVAIDFDTQYDYSGAPGKNAAVMWALTPTRPFIFLEGVYEQEVGWVSGPNPLPIGHVLLRRQLWAPFADGASAVIFGNNPLWAEGSTRLYTSYSGTWQQNMDYAGSQFLAKFADITRAIGPGWAQTVQDATSTFVTNQGSGDTKVSARFSGDLGIVYHPHFASGSINLDMTEFSARWSQVSLTRYDPASGASQLVNTYGTTAAQSVSAPVANSRGDRDWLFVVRGTTAK